MLSMYLLVDALRCSLDRAPQSLDRAVSTNGHGAHGITDPLGPDALFSQVGTPQTECILWKDADVFLQGAIKASAKGQVLATVNVRLTNWYDLGDVY